MHRLIGEDSIFNSPEDMVESILYICKNYEVIIYQQSLFQEHIRVGIKIQRLKLKMVVFI